MLVPVLVAATVAAVVVAPGGRAESAPAGWKLTWNDEFDGSAGSPPDPKKWAYDRGDLNVNHELEWYTDRTANVRLNGGGQLEIVARKETVEEHAYTSGRILTRGHYATRYGRIEARIEIPGGQGLWPAFWMLGDDIASVGWPDSGEVDIMENIGREPAVNHGTMHGPGYSGADGLTSMVSLPSGALSDAYHDYAIEWSPYAITWFLDGTAYATQKRGAQPAADPWVFDHPFFFLLNVAVGGDWPGNPDGTTVFPQTMSVDWVRVYKPTGPDTAAPTAPAAPHATHRTPRSVTLAWGASADESPLAGYDVYRGAAKVATTRRLAARIVGLRPNTRYSFSVVARDVAGNASAHVATAARTCSARKTRC